LKHYAWDKHCLYQSTCFEACSQWHQARATKLQAEATSEGYGLEIGHLEAAKVRGAAWQHPGVKVLVLLYRLAGFPRDVQPPDSYVHLCICWGEACKESGSPTPLVRAGVPAGVQAAGRRAVDIARASSLPHEAMLGLLRTVDLRLEEANRDNDSVYMQPKVPVGRLPPIGLQSLAKV
jgi:hypothetical protein